MTTHPRPLYTACIRCTEKLFATRLPPRCPRCSRTLLPPDRSATPPWGSDGRAARGAGGESVSRRSGARYDLRAAPGAMAQKEDDELQPETEGVARTLACCVRVMTDRQIAGGFFSRRKDPLDCARRAIRALERSRLVVTRRCCIGVPSVEAPLLRCEPDGRVANCSTASWVNQSRWREAKARQATCVFASEAGRLAFGGSCRQPREDELEHDVAVAAVWLRLQSDPSASDWRHEDSLPRESGYRPDATYTREGGEVAVDVLGRGYTRQKIDAVIAACGDRPLELW